MTLEKAVGCEVLGWCVMAGGGTLGAGIPCWLAAVIKVVINHVNICAFGAGMEPSISDHTKWMAHDYWYRLPQSDITC